MGNFKANGRNQGPNRRRGAKGDIQFGIPQIEPLERRRLLNAGPWQPTSTLLTDAQNGPMANLGGTLIGVYSSYTNNHGDMAKVAAAYPLLQFNGSMVKAGINSGGNDFNALLTSLKNLGMQVSASSATYGLIEGYVPINQLPTVARLPQTMSGHPIYTPSIAYKGIANNESATAISATTLQGTGVTGAGITVGVLSDSVNRVTTSTGTGLAASYATGDLANGSVQVIEDYTGSDATDEGRAMLENVHDVAPGASLAFATAFNSELGFANNILALASQAGAKVIVDDVSYFDEPFFQPGIIQQSIDTVVANGVTYFSSAGNEGNQGYLSTFRGVNGSVTGLGSGRFMNFDPTGGTNMLLPITTDGANAVISFQFDQPYKTQQPANSTASVTSQVNFYVLDANGNIVAQGTDNNVATQSPIQILTIPNAGSYYVAIQVVSGGDPGHIEFAEKDENVNLTVSQQYGSSGGTYYPTSVGHNAGASTIGVGATPWWATAPYLNQSPLASETYSSFGPNIQIRDAFGNLLSAPLTIQNPTITAPDGGNTSFFGQVIDTTKLPPQTSTNLSQNLPSFFGTSSAAPNAAGVAALMLQQVPNLTPAQIKAGLIASATGMNGAATGTWNAQAGYGEINAVAAVAAVNVLTVSSTTPANLSTVSSSPSYITVNFSKPVKFSTLTSADLVFSSAPAGVTVAVGAPVAVDDPTNPSVVRFPITLTRNGVIANGSYTYKVINADGKVSSTDGKLLQNSGDIKFTLSDTVAPTVSAVNLGNRLVTIKFSEAIDPSTVTPQNFFLQRKNGQSDYSNPATLLPTSVTYNPNTFTVTLDYSGYSQANLPTDSYRVVVAKTVSDAVGNFIDGTYNGILPSGSTPQIPGTEFDYDLGLQTVGAPQITYLQLQSSSDTGVANDANTNSTTPSFIGQVATGFLGSVGGLTVYISFGGLHNGITDLATDSTSTSIKPSFPGITGSFDIKVVTNADGSFTFTAPSSPTVLAQGTQFVKVVAVGQLGGPTDPVLSSLRQLSFRVDTTSPTVVSSSIVPGSNLSSLTNLSLNVSDPVNPTTGALATPANLDFAALDPTTASNINNYTLVRVKDAAGNTVSNDFSQYVATATYVSLASTTAGGFVTAYNGRVDLTFNTGLPAGTYQLIVKKSSGIRDAAGNALGADFTVSFGLQSQAAFVTNYTAYSPGNVTTGQRAYYEATAAATKAALALNPSDPLYQTSITDLDNYTARGDAAPTSFAVDFSNPLPYADSSNNKIDYTKALQLIASRNSDNSPADGEFGNLGQGGLGSSGSGFTRISSVTVTLQYRDANGNWQTAGAGQNGTRLLLSLQNGTTLAPDYYRVYMPNSGAGVITDIYGNQLDGENLGDLTAAGTYEDLLPNGQYRKGVSGDGTAGGAFVTGFVVVNTGNYIYARPDYHVDPLNSDTYSDGSLAKPYAVLAPEGDPSRSSNLNDPANFLNGFNKAYDRNGDGQFEQSAFYAASQLAKLGPVAIMALAGTSQRNPVTGVISEAAYVFQAPSGSNATINDGSGSVPAMTGLVLGAGATVKLSNASLYVQNQGSALQALGGGSLSDHVTFTSYKDDTVGGDTNNDGSASAPAAGNWGGIVFRNLNQLTHSGQTFAIDGTLRRPDGSLAISGSDDVMSILNFVDMAYAGGAVPQTGGTRFDAVTLYNSRPTITNSYIQNTGGTGASQAAISGDMDSFRDDDTGRGPLIRRVTLANNSLNGIWVRPNANGLAAPTDAMSYPVNPASQGSVVPYTFDDPLPYIFTSEIAVGSETFLNSGVTANVAQRLYIQPGMLIKSAPGSSLQVVNDFSSLNIGDRTYITQYDANNNISPLDANFKAPTSGDAQVIFTSLYDNSATTSFFDPATLTTTTIVAANNATNNTNSALIPKPGNVPAAARWGAIMISEGARFVMNEATIEYGGGAVHTGAFSYASQNVLTLQADYSGFTYGINLNPEGSRSYITNNNFYDNLDAAIAADANALLAGDALRPLSSGTPFIRGNVLLRNDINGLAVLSAPTYGPNATGGVVEAVQAVVTADAATLNVNSVWSNTDIAYVVRGTIILAGYGQYGRFGNFFGDQPPMPTPGASMPSPSITLTIQSALPGQLLADGSTIARPGESMVVKFLNDPLNSALSTVPGDAVNGSVGGNMASQAGAGFIVGVDDGVDPPGASELIGSGWDAQLRIIGIAANETTGQARVPVVFTSLLDSSVPRTVRGIDQSSTFVNAATSRYNSFLQGRTTPKAGDGGLIYFGGLMLTDYNLWDSRDGSIVQDADISYMTRIEVQGGGISDLFNTNPTPVPAPDPAPPNTNTTLDLNDNVRAQQTGSNGFYILVPPVAPSTIPTYRFIPSAQAYLNEFNTAQAMTFANSNFRNFSSAGILAHPGQANGLFRNVGATIGTGDTAIINGQVGRSGFAGQPVDLFLYNNTFSNMPVGVRMNSETGNDATQQNTFNITLLNNTFYNTDIGFFSNAPGFSAGPPPNFYSSVLWMAMDNIFSNNAIAGIEFVGQQYNTQSQYNVFWKNGQDIINSSTDNGWGGNNGPVYGDPKFRDPANGDFRLMAGSAAIDAARSEFGPSPIGNALAPVTTQSLTPGGTGTRNYTGRLGGATYLGDYLFPTNVNYTTTDIVALPGYSLHTFYDQWVPALNGSSNSYTGSAANAGTFAFTPISGQRSQAGYQRLDDPSTPNVGFGSLPFFDIGAYEYRALTPPQVVGVTALIGAATAPTNFYLTTSTASASSTPNKIYVKFNSAIDPATLTSATVLLQESGGDGIFGNANSSNDKYVNLAGKLTYDSANQTLIIDLAGTGLTLADDSYRLTLVGTGTSVIASPSGDALDGENTSNNDDPNGKQLALPSGDQFPGGNFTLNFIINATPPTITPGSLALASSSDSNISGDLVTNNARPTFTGSITVKNPLVQPIAGQIVVLDVSTKGDGNFDRMNVGTALTDASGNFSITVGTDGAATGLVTNASGLADSLYNVGPDGKLIPVTGGDTTGASIVRVRIIDSGGNSAGDSDPNARTSFIEDSTAPTITLTSPAAGTVYTSLTNNQITFEFKTSENIDLTKLNSSSIQIFRAGPDGILGTSDDVAVPISGAVTTAYLDSGTGGSGRMSIKVSTSGNLANDFYGIKLIGTGSNGIRDIAGNLVGVDLTSNFAVNVPTLSHIIYVGASSSYAFDPSAASGSRANPFSTINAGLAAAGVGDYVAVLPGVYREQVVLKQFVHLVSASTSSTDSNLIDGTALYTVIRAPDSFAGDAVSVIANNLASYNGLDTEIRGFSIDTPLVGNAAVGPIGGSSVGLQINNSDVLVNKNYFIDAATGIKIATSGSSAYTPRIIDNAIIGNITGISIDDTSSTTSVTKLTQIYNNTIANNSTGILLYNSSTSPAQATIANNIFWENHDLTGSRSGFAIYSAAPNKAFLWNNLFSGNGQSATSSADDTNNIGNGFDPTSLSSVAPDARGNFTGNPAFVSPRDPRPGSDGPAVFYNNGNFDLTANSAAIDRGRSNFDTGSDLLDRTRVQIRGSDPAFNFGPTDVGAFEYKGAGGAAIGGSFRVVTTSVAGGATYANGASIVDNLAPMSITVTLSSNVNKNSVTASDLVLSGSGVNSGNPVHATKLEWIDDHTVKFLLDGQYNSTGTVNISIPGGAITSQSGGMLPAYSDKIVLTVPVAAPSPSTTGSTTTIAPSPTPAPTAAPAPAPTSVKKHKVVIKKVHPKPKPHKAPVVRHKTPAHKAPVHNALARKVFVKLHK